MKFGHPYTAGTAHNKSGQDIGPKMLSGLNSVHPYQDGWYGGNGENEDSLPPVDVVVIG